ncbi:Gfo/Idh/MocA family protein [Limobrevibacterium gyesilva]|uniref:Gfo/Idh/MocA family oxidoreductase n=1 Tax=Limobrevibacterium gyesilva TaxID=2991712 RepID=A0AA42CFQ1_9PROT|nr:Gfo/Idh/MocA family oxidoreductase [Limobrevibacterium gyesilva]
MTHPARIAVVGAGLIGQAHIRRIIDEPDAALAGIADPSPRAKEQAGALGVPWTADIETMLAKAKPDGVVIATPNRLHVAGGLAAVAAGVPMLLEKPVADDVAGALRLVEAAEQTGVPILVGHHRRHSPLIQRAKEIVASGRLGKITAVTGLCWFLKPADYFEGKGSWRREPGAGVVLINLIHVVDDLRNICGDVASVQAAQSNAARGFPVEDTAAIILRFRNGALGTLTISDSAAAPWSWELTSGENKAYPHTDQFCYLVAGTEGSVTIPRLDVWHYGAEQHWWAPLEAQRSFVPEQDPLTLQMRHFCAVARGTAKPLLDGREGTRTLETTLAVKRAAATGEVVHLG